jgi:hypothetical protein
MELQLTEIGAEGEDIFKSPWTAFRGVLCFKCCEFKD